MKTLDGKVVTLTGAGSGIGRALALGAAARGARLALSDVNGDGLAETVDLLPAGTEVHTRSLDVADRDAMIAYAAEVAAHFGVVNVLVNNAGVSVNGSLLELPYEDLDWITGINYLGVVQGTKEFLPHLIASGDGHLVNISSLFGLIAIPGQSAYNAAKFAVRGFTESVRQEMLVERKPVGVTCVHPGGVRTGIVRNGRSHGIDSSKLAKVFDKKLARTSPEDAAEAIWTGVLKDRPRVLIGADAHLMHQLQRTLGASYQQVVVRGYRRFRF